MSYFKAEMLQNSILLGLCHRPSWEAYSTPPNLLAGFKGSISKGRGGEGR